MAYIIRTLFASSTRGAYLELNSVFQPRFSSMALGEYIKATLKDVYDNKKHETVICGIPSIVIHLMPMMIKL